MALIRLLTVLGACGLAVIEGCSAWAAPAPTPKLVLHNFSDQAVEVSVDGFAPVSVAARTRMTLVLDSMVEPQPEAVRIAVESVPSAPSADGDRAIDEVVHVRTGKITVALPPRASVDVSVGALGLPSSLSDDGVRILQVSERLATEPVVAPQGNDKLAISSPHAPRRTHRNSIAMTLVEVHPGSFVMGCRATARPLATERPHEVLLTSGFWIGQTEVSQREWDAIMDRNPSIAVGPQLPVNNVNWHEAMEFCRRLSEREGRVYRLPTEAQWEYACRAGTTTRYSFGDNVGRIDAYAWTNRNARGWVQPVGTRRANPWGIHDMHGNVAEWCLDWWSWRYPVTPQVDPKGPATGNQRIMRGGRADFYPLQSASRDSLQPTVTNGTRGFRVVLMCDENGA